MVSRKQTVLIFKIYTREKISLLYTESSLCQYCNLHVKRPMTPSSPYTTTSKYISFLLRNLIMISILSYGIYKTTSLVKTW